MRRLNLAVALALTLSGGLLVSEQGWLKAKAMLAEKLIERAFTAHLKDGEPHRPWKWADMHPVARLDVPRLGVRRIVLSGASGSSLAFGPGHVDGTAPPNLEGNCVLAGHRDSWFAFLGHLQVGDRLSLTSHSRMRLYEVRGVSVTSMWAAESLVPTEDLRLTLVTCYPFNGLAKSRLRYVVVCLPVDRDDVLRPGRPAAGDVLDCRFRPACRPSTVAGRVGRVSCPTKCPEKSSFAS